MDWPAEIDAVYVICHPTKEKQRFDRLIPHLLERGIPRDKLRVVAPCWGSDLSANTILAIYDPFLQRGCPTFTFKGANLTLGEISLGFNFYHCLRDAVDSKTQRVITLESDVYLREDFVPRLNGLLQDLQDRDWDYVSLGEGIGTRPDEVPKSLFSPTKAYPPPHNLVFRCTDSMLFQTKFLQKLVTTFVPFREIIDWEMNYQNMIHKGVAFWADPALVEQGTAFNRDATTLPS
jgi:hypothetical protein